MKRSFSIASLATACVTALVACGGGGSGTGLIGAGKPPAPPPTPSVQVQPVSCDALAKRAIPHTTILSSTVVPAGPLTLGGTPLGDMPEFCRVIASVSPSADEQIGIEVWLPTKAWNGRFLGTGSGGLGGAVIYQSLAAAVRQGFASAGTDTGHVGNQIETPNTFIPWMHNRAKVLNWGRTSIHEMTVAAKALTTDFYASEARFSYYSGCSTGGGEAMHEALYYPADYDGVHAGAPGSGYARLMSSFLWGTRVLHDNPGLTAKLSMVNAASLQACDALDGVTDGVIENPQLCKFSPVVLQCAAGSSGPDCLTASEVAGVEKIYGGAVNPRTREQIYPGMSRGSEAGWSAIPYITQGVAVPLMQNMVFDDLAWNYLNFDFDRDVAYVDDKVGGLITATSPDLSAFRAGGGKLLMTQGWADPFAAQTFPIDYHRDVVKTMGIAQTDDFYRLFMMPGVGHCAGGAGPNITDPVASLQAWVEHGRAPDRIVAAKHANDDPSQPVIRTRPLCPWPQTANYTGSGSTDDAANFSCK